MASEWKDCGSLMDWIEVFEKLIEIEKMLLSAKDESK